ncbi:MAG: hypothetical protein Q8P67_00345 [archaeon]|nr:hypothetical protein [archaeon]
MAVEASQVADVSFSTADTFQVFPVLSSEESPKLKLWARDNAHVYLFALGSSVSLFQRCLDSSMLVPVPGFHFSRSSAAAVVPVVSPFRSNFRYLWVMSNLHQQCLVSLYDTFLEGESQVGARLLADLPLPSSSRVLDLAAINSSRLLVTFADGSGLVSNLPQEYSLTSSSLAEFSVPLFEAYSSRIRICEVRPRQALFFGKPAPVSALDFVSGVSLSSDAPISTTAMLSLSVLTSDRVVFTLNLLSSSSSSSSSSPDAALSPEDVVRRQLSMLTAPGAADQRREFFDQLLAAGRISSICGCLFYAPHVAESFLWEREILSWAWNHAFSSIKASLRAHYEPIWSPDAPQQDSRAIGITQSFLRNRFGDLGLLHSIFQCLLSKNVTEEGARDLLQKVRVLLIESQLLELVSWLISNQVIPRFSPTPLFSSLASTTYIQFLLAECQIDLLDAEVNKLSLQLLSRHLERCDPLRVQAKRAVVYYALLCLTGAGLDPSLSEDFAAAFLLSEHTKRLLQALWLLDRGQEKHAHLMLTQSSIPIEARVFFPIMQSFCTAKLPSHALSLWRSRSSIPASTFEHAQIVVGAFLDALQLNEALRVFRQSSGTLTSSGDCHQLFNYFLERALRGFVLFNVLSLAYDLDEEQMLVDFLRKPPANLSNAGDMLGTFHLLRGKPYDAMQVQAVRCPLISRMTSELKIALPTASPDFGIAPVSLVAQAPPQPPFIPSRTSASSATGTLQRQTPIRHHHQQHPHSQSKPTPSSSNTAQTPSKFVQTPSKFVQTPSKFPQTPSKPTLPQPAMSTPMPSTGLSLSVPRTPSAVQEPETAADFESLSEQNFSPLRLRSGKSLPRTPAPSRTPRKPSDLSKIDSTLSQSPSQSPAGIRTMGRFRPRVKTNI